MNYDTAAIMSVRGRLSFDEIGAFSFRDLNHPKGGPTKAPSEISTIECPEFYSELREWAKENETIEFAYGGIDKIAAEYSTATRTSKSTVNYARTDRIGSPRVIK